MATDDRAAALAPVALGLRLLGEPLTPYQISAAARINALAADGTYLWPKVCILWPRQTGKTTSLALIALARARELQDYRCAYAAQTGHVTSQRFLEWIGLITARPDWMHEWRTRQSDGTERITARRTRGYLRAFPPIPGRLRSNALDMPIVDEAQEHSDDRIGSKLDADIIPTMSTRPRSQWIIAGTAGDATSTYWRRHYDLARAGTPGHLLIEIGTPPEDADIESPDIWARYHPGVRAGLTTIEKIAEARSNLGADRFAREYFNRWTTAIAISMFPAGAWLACHDARAGIEGRPSFALEVAPDRGRAAVVAAGRSTADSGKMHIELIDEIPLKALAQFCARLGAKHRVPFYIDPKAPAVTHLDEFRRSRVPIKEISTEELVSGSGKLYDRIAQGTLTHIDQAPLTAAAAAAASRRIGARWTFDRYAPGGHLLTAASLALLAAERAQHAEAPALLS